MRGVPGSGTALVAAALLAQAPHAVTHRGATPLSAESAPLALWFFPADLPDRDLYYGAGGREDQPQAPFTFVREDLSGSNPKYIIRDRAGVKWKVKLGVEARPETVASRLVWAVGYGVDEEYFLADLHVDGMPAAVHRGAALIGLDGTMRNARLKRETAAKVGTWRWRDNPFLGTREFNGLRVLMALINNWDVKDSNTAIYVVKDPEGGTFNWYEVSDLGGSFGSHRLERDRSVAKGNLAAYAHSPFIHEADGEYVTFSVPGRPALTAASPHEFMTRLKLRWIGQRIPRADARWIGRLLGQLSRSQLEDAFRAGGYSPDESAVFIEILMKRIRLLNSL